ARPAASRVRTIVDSLAHAYLDAGHSPGLSIEVVRGQDTLVRAGYGFADLEQRVAASPSTLYEIGSITKQFTAAAVMRFVEAGRIRLDDSIAAYVGDLPLRWRRVSVRQLLNHTSGIPSMTQPYSAGALCSTVDDLARWNVLLAGGNVVSPSSYRLMTTPEGAAQSHGYGFGLVADTLGGRRMIGHNGGINGFASANGFFPDDTLSVTV